MSVHALNVCNLVVERQASQIPQEGTAPKPAAAAVTSVYNADRSLAQRVAIYEVLLDVPLEVRKGRADF